MLLKVASATVPVTDQRGLAAVSASNHARAAAVHTWKHIRCNDTMAYCGPGTILPLILTETGLLHLHVTCVLDAQYGHQEFYLHLHMYEYINMCSICLLFISSVWARIDKPKHTVMRIHVNIAQMHMHVFVQTRQKRLDNNVLCPKTLKKNIYIHTHIAHSNIHIYTSTNASTDIHVLYHKMLDEQLHSTDK